jgi:hypothetical protein
MPVARSLLGSHRDARRAEVQGWPSTDEAINGGGFPFYRRDTRNLRASCARGLRNFTMWKNLKVSIEIKVNLAACLFALAAILRVLM